MSLSGLLAPWSAEEGQNDAATIPVCSDDLHFCAQPDIHVDALMWRCLAALHGIIEPWL